MADLNPNTNLVIQTNILKALEILEDKARKDWHKKWGFYLDFPEIILKEAAAKGISEERYKYLMKSKKEKEKAYECRNLIDVIPSDFVPKTSSGFIGQRSDLKYSLEKFGAPLYISPKSTLPYQQPYYSIYLG